MTYHLGYVIDYFTVEIELSDIGMAPAYSGPVSVPTYRWEDAMNHHIDISIFAQFTIDVPH